MRWISALAVVIMSVLVTGPAIAGGWAVSSLDSVAPPRAGRTVEVGFTIRQHGVTPVNPENDVGIVIRSKTGLEEFFVAEPDGEVGHFVTAVTFPEAGAWTWGVRQGWFGEQDLGRIDVAPAVAEAVAPDNGQAGAIKWVALFRVGLPMVAVALGGVALADSAFGRRRRAAAV